MATKCGACNANMQHDPWHYLACKFRRKNELNMRHDQVGRNIALFCSHAGIVSRIEPSGLSEDDRLRPDLHLMMDQYNKFVDVTIVHPTCPSHIHAAQTQLKTAEDAAKAKINKYKDLAKANEGDIVPFAIESYGGYSEAACRLIEEIAVFASTHESAWSKAEIIADLKAAVAISVQRGNAHAAVAGYRACSRAG